MDKLKVDFGDLETIGVLGGLGPQATMDFEQRLHHAAQQCLPQKNNMGYPPMYVGYFREIPIVQNADGTFAEPIQAHPGLLAMAEKLGALSDFIVIASNTPHFWKTEIETAAGKEVLSMVDVTIAEVADRKAVKVGLMAIGFTSKHRLYQEPLEVLGIDYFVLPDEFVDELDTALFAVMEGREDDGSRRIAHQALQYLRSAGADQIILGCTEVPLLLADELASTDVINPAEILARAAVRRAIEHRP